MGRIWIIGVGFAEDSLTLGAAKVLRSAPKIILHTGRCGLTAWLDAQSLAYETLDALYEQAEDFDQHAEMATNAVLNAAKGEDVAYCVFDLRDASVAKILELADEMPTLMAGMPSEGALMAWCSGDVEILSASDWEEARFSACRDVLIREIDSRELAGEIKLKLLDCFPEDTKMFILLNGTVVKLDLVKLDRLKHYDHMTSALIPAQKNLQALERYDFDDLNRVMRILRGENGCPWDCAQTHQSLRGNMIEEAWEAVDAIDKDDMYQLSDELGDMLMQVCLHSEIARQHGEFDISDVTTAICKKMIFRHAHIFGSAKAENAEDVLTLWQEQKRRERGDALRSDALRSIANGLPSLTKAEKLFGRLADAGIDEALPTENIMKEFLENPNEDTLGKLLLTIAQQSKKRKLDAELSLGRECRALTERFCRAENGMSGADWDALPADEKMKRWNEERKV